MNPTQKAIQRQTEEFRSKYGEYPKLPIVVTFLWAGLAERKDGLLDLWGDHEHGHHGHYVISFIKGVGVAGLDGMTTSIADPGIGDLKCIRDGEGKAFP